MVCPFDVSSDSQLTRPVAQEVSDARHPSQWNKHLSFAPSELLLFLKERSPASHLWWKQKSRLSSTATHIAWPPRDSRSQMLDDHQSPDKTPELACNSSATHPPISQHCIGSSAEQPHEAFRHSATVNSELDYINSFAIARNASHFTAKRASSAFVTIERLSTKNRRPRADRPLRVLRTDRLRVKLKDLRGRAPVGRFFSFYFCWLLHRLDVLYLLITSRFTFLFVVLCVCEWQGCSRTWRSFCRTIISLQRAFKLKKLEWQCGWEYKQAFSC